MKHHYILVIILFLFLPCLQAQTISDGYYVIRNVRYTAYYLHPTNQNNGSVLKIDQGYAADRIWKMTNVNGELYYMQNYATGYYTNHTSGTDAGCVTMSNTDSPGTANQVKVAEYSSGVYAIIPYANRNSGSGSNISFNPYSGVNGNIGLWRYDNDAGSRWNYYPVTFGIENTMTGETAIVTDGSYSYTVPDGLDVYVNGSATADFSLDGDNFSYSWSYTSLPSGVSATTAGNELTLTCSSYQNGSVTLTCVVTDAASGSSATIVKTVQFYVPQTVSTLSELQAMGSGIYTLANDIDASDLAASITGFSGMLDGQFHKITGLSVPLFDEVNGAVVKNLIIDGVSISGGNTAGDAGAIACSATGATRIYNCGILSGSVEGSRYVGGILGDLEGNSRVINCYSFATVSGGTWAAGIVGYNSMATTQSNISTSGMVMNCIFYGEVASGDNIAPVYGGSIISNDNTSGTALNTYNYFRFMADFCQNGSITAYNCALACKEMNLKRAEFYRYQLNSNRPLAAWYATGSTASADASMAKWVLDKSVAPYPVLKPQGEYPSIVNFDAANAPDPVEGVCNQGAKLGTLAVTISGTGTGAPSRAAITTSSLTLNITDKDTANYNFNYYKVQLPYYNQVGSGNYTDNKVVTGWKVTVTGGTTSFTTTGKEYPDYNFADRHCTKKDNYENSGRVFPQGGYFNVPEGVSSISIEPYWGKAVYLADAAYDVVYTSGYTGTRVSAMGSRYVGGSSYTINGSSQVVCTSVSDALNALGTSGTVYDQAIVLVGNYHLYAGNNENPFGNSKPCTIMSADLNADNEPDCSLIFHFHERKECPPIRFDFINVMPFGMAQKVYTATQMPNIAIFKVKGWFEVTTTCLVEFTEFEYDYESKSAAPLIFLGGVIGQITSQNTSTSYNADRTTYIHLGDNVYFENFCNGGHSDKRTKTRHCPISVTGGEYRNFYLSGLYRSDTNHFDDNAECYVNGGRFGEVAGAAHEVIDGNVYWRVDHADITSFFGGGINAGNPVSGNIDVVMNNSRVDLYCGGPKFGDMTEGKTVTTVADSSVFGTFFGAGYGGTALNRVISQSGYNSSNYDWDSWANSYTRSYNSTYKAVAASYETEFFAWAGGTATSNVGRFYINFASLSLANTYSVTSTLTHCTLLTDFYGGGSLGSVTGSVTSLLDSCTVLGSVYGAGFSASVPSVEVFPTTGFVTRPSYNSNVGLYIDPVYPTAVSYTWSSQGSNNSPFTENSEGNWIYTNVDLDALGKVTGNVTLTLSGNTEVQGSVFGGGNAAAVEGDASSVTVNIKNTSVVNNSVFGGGNAASVGTEAYNNATIQVNILDRTLVKVNVYGGGNKGTVYGNTHVGIGGLE